MKKKIKKAFTLVELLVVIAILAILATVSIVGYNSFTKKAKVSNDTTLVTQLNTLLKADSMVNGDAKTPTDALKITSEAGYDVEKLTPTASDYDIIWNQKTNQFALLDEKGTAVYGEKSTEEYKNWKFVSEYNSATDYSVYLKGTEITSIPNVVHAGIDVGNNTAITTVNYTNSDSKDDVRIRTNGGTLSVDASNDAVWHYGDVQNVSIKAIDNESYHEAGTVSGNLEIESGHLAIENAANVSTIIVKPTNTVKVTVTKEVNVGTIVTTDTTKTILNVPESLKPSENITDAKLNEISNFAGGLGTERSPYLISTAEEFVNIGKYSDVMKNGVAYNFKLISDIDLNTYTNFNKFGANNNYAISGYFNGTLVGTKNNESNYKIISNDLLDYVFISSFSKSSFKDIDYYFVNNLVQLCPGQCGNTTTIFDNVDLYTVDPNTNISLVSNQGLYISWIAFDFYNNKWTINNDVTIKNADVYVNIVGTGYNAVFFGGSPYYGGSGNVLDSKYYGNYYGEAVNLVLGNQAYQNTFSINVENVENKGILASTVGTPMIAGGNYTNGTPECKYATLNNVKLGVVRYLYDSNIGISNSDNGLLIDEASSSSTAYYTLTFIGGTRYIPPYGENSTYTFAIRIEKSQFENGKYQTLFKDGKLATVKQYKELIDSEATFDNSKSIKLCSESNVEFWNVEKNSVNYYVFDFHDNDSKYFITKPNKVIKSSIVDINSAMITAYDENGLPIAQKTIKL